MKSRIQARRDAIASSGATLQTGSDRYKSRSGGSLPPAVDMNDPSVRSAQIAKADAGDVNAAALVAGYYSKRAQFPKSTTPAGA